MSRRLAGAFAQLDAAIERAQAVCEELDEVGADAFVAMIERAIVDGIAAGEAAAEARALIERVRRARA